MSDEDDKKAPLTFEEAVAMLPDGDYIHTFRSNPICLVGADWEREELLEAIKKGRPEKAGPGATSMGHALAIWTGDEPLFVETREEAI